MNTQQSIDELVSICKATVHITFNEHKTNYETIEEYLSDSMFDRFSDVEPELKQQIIDKDLIVEVQAYPRTPVGFILSVHYDLNEALKQAIEGAKNY
jgi:hypothetical protein